MPLKIELKPNERLIVGNALITNDRERTRLYIDGNVPILREKYILTEEQADTPCKKSLLRFAKNVSGKRPENSASRILRPHSGTDGGGAQLHP